MFPNEYYRLNEFLMSCIGQWPYQERKLRRTILVLVMVAILSLVVPQVIKLLECIHDVDMVIDCLTPLLTNTTCFMKLYNCVFNAAKMRRLFDCIKRDWLEASTEAEVEVLEKYADNSRRMTELYTFYMFGTMAIYSLIPLSPQLLDYLFPLNESRPLKYMYHVQYYIDHDKYFYPLLLHALGSTIVSMTILIGADTLYMTYVEHACGKFAVIGNRLKNMKTIDQYFTDSSSIKDRDVLLINQCVSEHNKAIEFAAMIESTYTVVFFFLLGFIIILMSISGIQVVNKMGQPETMLRFGLFTLAQIIHLFCNSLPGQRLTDHSLSVGISITQANWYKVSLKAKRMLIIIIMRSSRYVQLTAGKLYIMNMANFAMVVQTSMSYFTVLSSMQ